MNRPSLMHVGFIPKDGLDECIANVFENVLPPFLKKLDRYFAGPGKFMFGDKLTIADFWIGGMYVNNFVNPNIMWGEDRWEETLA